MKRVTPEQGMTIEFTHDELRDLLTIVGNIAGSFDGPRGTAHKLFEMLTAEGVEQSRPLPDQHMMFPG